MGASVPQVWPGGASEWFLCRYRNVAGVGTQRALRAGRKGTQVVSCRGPEGCSCGCRRWEGACSQWPSGPHLPAASEGKYWGVDQALLPDARMAAGGAWNSVVSAEKDNPEAVL